MKAVVAAFNQEKAVVGAFSMIAKTDGSFAALMLGAEADTQVVEGRGEWKTYGSCSQ